MSKLFPELHPLVQQFVNDSLRPMMLMLAEQAPEGLPDLRQMLVSSAKGTIDLELDIRQRGGISPPTKPKIAIYKGPVPT